MILVFGGVFSRFLHRRQETPEQECATMDRRKDHDKRRAWAEKEELEAAVDALIRQRTYRERLARDQ